MSDTKEIKKDLIDIDPETIIEDLVKMVRKLKSEEEADCVRAGKEHPEYPYIPLIEYDIPAEDSPMQKITEEVGDFLFSLRKDYGMFRQVGISIVCVTREKISVIIEENRVDSAEEEVILGIRNGFLNFLQDVLPCPFFQGIYYNRSKRRYANEHFLPFYEDKDVHEVLKSPVIPIEENLGPDRERVRPIIKELWDKL
jgi:hypothetical protein